MNATTRDTAVTATEIPKMRTTTGVGLSSGVAQPGGRRRRRLPGLCRRDGWCGSSDVHTVVAGDPGQTGGVPLADGAELPLRPVAVQLAEDHGGLGRRVLRQVVAGDLVVVRLVDDADEGVADLTERLRPRVGVVDRDGEDDRV